jgi:hypothetical protein
MISHENCSAFLKKTEKKVGRKQGREEGRKKRREEGRKERKKIHFFSVFI